MAANLAARRIPFHPALSAGRAWLQLRRSNFQQHRAMLRNCRRECIVEGAEIPLLPEIADRLGALESQVRPFGGHLRRVLAAVEQADRNGSVPQRTKPDFD